MTPEATLLVRPAAAELAEVAGMLDQYRRHHRDPVTAGQTLAWLTQHTRSGLLIVFAARIGEEMVGIATTVALPASLRLGSAWQLRDL